MRKLKYSLMTYNPETIKEFPEHIPICEITGKNLKDLRDKLIQQVLRHFDACIYDEEPKQLVNND